MGTIDDDKIKTRAVRKAYSPRLLLLEDRGGVFVIIPLQNARTALGQAVQLIEQLILRPEAAGKPGRQQDEQLFPAHRSFRARQTFSAVMGISRMRTPQAFSSALAMAGQGVSITTSPMLLAPNGPCSS